MAVDNLSKKISDLNQHIEDLRTRSISDPGNMAEVLSDAVDELQVNLEELSTAEEELYRQNEELIRSREELQEAKDHLEVRVKERTAELQNAKEELEVINEELSVEIDEHKRTEKELIKAKEAAEEAAKVKGGLHGQHEP